IKRRLKMWPRRTCDNEKDDAQWDGRGKEGQAQESTDPRFHSILLGVVVLALVVVILPLVVLRVGDVRMEHRQETVQNRPHRTQGNKGSYRQHQKQFLHDCLSLRYGCASTPLDGRYKVMRTYENHLL